MDFADRLGKRILRSHVKAAEKGMTAAAYLASLYRRFDLAGWQAAIAAGKVTVNGTLPTAGLRLKEHDCVAFMPGDMPEPEADLTFSVLYSDADIAVLNKSGDLCVHPTGPFFRHTLWHLAGQELGELRFITRLDRETSGLVLACRNRGSAAAAEAHLQEITKEYFALVEGHFPGSVQARGVLVKDEKSAVEKKKKFLPVPAASAAGVPVYTELFAEEYRENHRTLVKAVLHTGRQHQIRATLFSLGFPLVGDKLYGRDERIFLKIREKAVSADDLALLGMSRQALHAGKLTFPHPVTGKIMTFTVPCPF